MHLIATNFHHNDFMWSLSSLARKTKISEQALSLVISALHSNNLITTTGEKNQFYLPQQSLENITVEMILTAARRAEETPSLHPDDVEAPDKINKVITLTEKAIIEVNNQKTLKDLI